MTGDFLNLLNQQFDEGNVRLFHHPFTSSFFCFNSQFHRQTDGTAIGSLLSFVTPNFFIENFKEVAISTVVYKPTCWFCYMDGTFITLPHGLEKVNNLLNHLNNIQPSIQFTMQTESHGHLPFLDTGIYSRPDGSL
jgi:hypothetical protein